MPDYQTEAAALDAVILGVIERWHRTGEGLDERAFNDLALRIFEYQLRYNAPYGRYCSALGIASAPASWEQIPAVPAPAFKEASLTTFDRSRAALIFETSGTTDGRPGRHYMEASALYDAASLATFDRLALANNATLRYLNLVPNPSERPRSSLGYMMAQIARHRGDGRTGWYVRGDRLLIDEFLADARAAIAERAPVFIAATAFALVHVLDAMSERRVGLLLPAGSLVMETGGFKGRTQVVERHAFYGRIAEAFGVATTAIVSEYGMTELTSQYYRRDAAGAYNGPAWLRARVVGPERTALEFGEVGALLHVDLANRASCIAIQTEDRGVMTPQGFVLFDRNEAAELRGCSLDAEELYSSRSAPDIHK